jgi:hypothetical protein
MKSILSRQKVYGKLGSMRANTDWSVYPHKAGNPDAIIQCDKRIAKINLETGEGVVSDGKSGHNNFMGLNSFLGAKPCKADALMIADIKAIVAGDDGSGTIVAIG